MPECPACRVAYIEGESHVCTPGRGWRELRLFAGFVVQPFVAAALGFLCFPLVELSGRALYGGTTDDATRAAVSFAAGVGIVAFFVTLCGALPAVLWCLKRGRLTLKHVLLGAVGLGNVPFAIIVPLASATTSAPSGPGWFWPAGAIRALVAGSLFGLVGGAVFWAISVRGTGASRDQQSG